jgi:hypothetical protein
VSRYTAAEREEAALICAISASSDGMLCSHGLLYSTTAEHIEATHAADVLAASAWQVAIVALGGSWTPEVDAEAECLIRNGEI